MMWIFKNAAFKALGEFELIWIFEMLHSKHLRILTDMDLKNAVFKGILEF